MTEQSIRDEARAYIHKKRPEWHDNGVGIVQGSHYRSGFADGAEWALTASSVIRRIQAEAHDQGYRQGIRDASGVEYTGLVASQYRGETA